MKKAKRVKKRIVLGEGHPWYGVQTPGAPWPSSVQLTKKRVPVAPEEIVCLDTGDTGNWNRVRLVLEVLE